MIVNRTNVTVRGRVISVNPLTVTPSGNSVVNFRIAANERQFDSATNTWSDRDTFFVSVTAWDQLARRVAAVPMNKQLVVVMGTLSTRSYEKNGERRSFPEIRAQHVAFDVLALEAMLRPGPAAASSDETAQSAGGPADPASAGAAASGTAEEVEDVTDGGEALASDIDADATQDEGEPVVAGVGASLADISAPF